MRMKHVAFLISLFLVFSFLFTCAYAEMAFVEKEFTVSSGSASGSVTLEPNFMLYEVRWKTNGIDAGDSVTLSLVDNFANYTVWTATDSTIVAGIGEVCVLSNIWDYTITNTSTTTTTSGNTATSSNSGTSTGTNTSTATMTDVTSGTLSTITSTVTTTDTVTNTVSDSVTTSGTTTNVAVVENISSASTTRYFGCGPTMFTITFSSTQEADRVIRVKLLGKE